MLRTEIGKSAEHGMTTHTSSLVVLDFETSGLKPEQGARVIEIGAVRVQNGAIGETFQTLVNPGQQIHSFISQLTGITNRMLADAPKSSEAFQAFREFLGVCPFVAHNTHFDRHFLLFELQRLGFSCANLSACSLLAARRIVPEAPCYRLSALTEHCGLPQEGNWHRALADAVATARLWLYMEARLRQDYGLHETPFSLMLHLTQLRRGRQTQTWLRQEAERQRNAYREP